MSAVTDMSAFPSLVIMASHMATSAAGPGEDTILFYQSGVEFVGLTSDALLALRRLLARLGDAATPAKPRPCSQLPRSAA